MKEAKICKLIINSNMQTLQTLQTLQTTNYKLLTSNFQLSLHSLRYFYSQQSHAGFNYFADGFG